MPDTATNRETALLLARVEDLAEQCRTKQYPVFLGFLDPAQHTLAADRLKYSGLCFSFWGGYEDAERVYLGIFPGQDEDRDNFPFACLEFAYRTEDSLGHRDFLGSLMALRIKREAVGDICVEPGRCFLFLTLPAAQVAQDELVKIGRVGVTVSRVSMGELTFTRSFLPVSGTAASLRLDGIVALLGNLSRTAAAKLITTGLVALNGVAVVNGDRQVAPGDRISIRGVGKFIYDGQDGVSRKDRLRLTFKKYQ